MNELPKERPAETGVIIRKQFVSFAVTESGRDAPPTPADIRAWRKQLEPEGLSRGWCPLAICC